MDGTAIKNNKGKQELNKKLIKHNTLTESVLTGYSKVYVEQSGIQVNKFKYFNMAYAISIISYFAAKQVMYESKIYTSDNKMDGKVYTTLLGLTAAGMLMNNVSEDQTFELINQMKESIKHECKNIGANATIVYNVSNKDTLFSIM
jgi:hypothetical protein